MQHPSKDSPADESPSSSPPRPTSGDPPSPTPAPTPTPAQATGGEGSGSGGVSGVAVAGGAVGVGGSVEKAVDPSGGSGEGTKRKRKPSDVIDPPSGTPKCDVCLKEFASWKAAFGHMRAHPNRQYRGFFKPPDFSSTSTAPAQEVPADQAQGIKKNKKSYNYFFKKKI